MRRYLATMPAVDALITQMQVGQRATEDILPPEIRNQLYTCAVFPGNIESVERTFKSTGPEGTIVVSDTTRASYLDSVSDAGRSTLFCWDLQRLRRLQMSC
jgi:hypothetical protein